MPNSTPCAAPECDRLAARREWCHGHYARVLKTGSPGDTPLRKQMPHGYSRGICSVLDCGLREHCKGFCKSHYVRNTKGLPESSGKPRQSLKSIDFEDGTRQCNACGHRKELVSFYPHKSCRLGRRAVCIECCQDRDTKRRRLVPEVYTAQSALRRARKASAASDPGLTHEALRARDGDSCSYCAVRMTFEYGKLGVWVAHKASIDHVVPLSKGGAHTFDNCVLACLQCNVRKHDKDAETWRK